MADLKYLIDFESDTGDLDKSSDSFKKLDAEAQKLEKSFSEIEHKQVLIKQFVDLKNATIEARDSWRKAEAATGALAKQFVEAETKVKALKSAIDAQTTVTKAQRTELNKAERFLKSLTKQQEKSAENAKKLKTNYETVNAELQQTRNAMRDAGLSTKNLSKQQKDLINETKQVERAVIELNTEVKKLDQIAKAKRTLGLDVDEKVKYEINAINKAFVELKNSGTLTQHELARASDLHKQRIGALQAELGQTAHALDKVESSSKTAHASFGSLGKTLLGFAGAYVGLDAVKTGIEQLVSTAKELDSLNQKLEYATGGAKQAGETFDYLKDIANQLGLEQMSLANGYAQLASATKNLNMSTADTNTAFEGVANATAAMSLSADEANGVFLALAQIAGKGKVSMEELRGQLGERLTPAMGIAAKAMGVTTTELEKMVENGINAKEFLPKFGAALTDAFGEQAQNNINTTAGSFNLVSNKLTELKAKILDSFAGDGITSATQVFADSIDRINHAIDDIDPATIEAVKQVFAQLFALVGTLAEGLSAGYDNLNNLLDAFTGVDAASEKVSFLTRTIQGLSIVIGAVDDVFKGLNATTNLTLGGITAAFAKLYGAMAKLDILPDSMQAKYQQLSDGLQKTSDDAFARFEKNVNEFESSTKKALDATIVTTEQMAAQAEDAAQKASDSFAKLAKSGQASAEALANGFKEAVDKATTTEQVNALITQYGELGKQGKITGEQLADGVNTATAKMQELAKSGQASAEALAAMGKAGEKTAEDIKTQMADAATALELDFNKASTQVTKSLQQSASGITSLINNFDELKKGGYDASVLIMQGLQTLQKQANNTADYDYLIKLWQDLGKEGLLSTDQMTAGLEETRKKSLELKNSLAGVTDAYNTLGLQSAAELTKKAAEYQQAYEQIAKDATATESIKQQAYEKYAQAAIEANNNLVSSELITQAIARGYADVVVENGKIATKTAEQIAEANKQVAQAHHQQAKAANEVATAETKAAEATEKSAKSLEGMTSLVYANAKIRINGLQKLGATTEQTDAIMQKFADSMRNLPFPDYYKYTQQLNDYTKQTQAQADAFAATRTAAEEMTETLGKADVSTQELSEAQQMLSNATDASIGGIVKMDDTTLDNLKNAIDGARKRMQGLADDAKDTADSIEASLAKLQGKEDVAREIEQTKKLKELNEKMTAAKKRGNDAETEQLQRAIELQKQLYDEEVKQAEQKKAKEAKKEEAKKEKEEEKARQQAQQQQEKANKIAVDLAKAKGDDEQALLLEKQKQIDALKYKMTAAKARGNDAETEQLQRAIDLQKQLYDEKLETLNKKDSKKTSSTKLTQSTSKPSPYLQPSQTQEPLKVEINLRINGQLAEKTGETDYTILAEHVIKAIQRSKEATGRY